MKKVRKRKFILGLIALVVVNTIIYNVYDNNRMVVKEQDVIIERLPDEFDGFKILQITDLHGKSFGKDQSKLISLINSLDYDMIAITGDMNNTRSTDSKEFLKLLDGIEDKEFVFYVNGNIGPFAYDEFTGEITDEGKILEEKGCILLTKPYEIQRGNDTLLVSNFLSEFNLGQEYPEEFFDSKEDYILSKEYKSQLKEIFYQVNNTNSVKILLNHYPKPKRQFSQENIDEWGDLKYDLVIAGHYHGGQFRLPFIGALYIPDATSQKKGLFPEQQHVMGLTKYYDTQQYVSAGLGASNSIKLLGFRLFNTPEVNVITLKNHVN